MGRHNWLAEVVEQIRPGVAATLPAHFPDSPTEAWLLAERAAGVTEQQLVEAVAAHFSLEVAALDIASQASIRLLPYALALRHRALPLALEHGRLRVAVCDASDTDTLERLRFVTTYTIVPEIHSAARIENAVLRLYGEAAQREASESIDLDAAPATDVDLNPVVRLARKFIRLAVERRATDLHFQPYLGGYLVRARVDGVLARLSTLTHDVGTHVVRHFKAISAMDSTDANTPQDGRCTVYLDHNRFDLRISSVPNYQGERLVIRLLNQSRVFSLEKLGYAPARVQSLSRVSLLDSGLVLFAGPTGSGKTTALYALVSTLNTMDRSIATIEQPIEYVQPGLSQVEVQPERGATFASVLRAQLRQDPDVLLIGEIRDQETAEAAVRAALTGHLVFSTLHTSAARYAVPRLLDLGVSAPMLGETLRGVISQRLARKLCACATPVTEPLTPTERLFREITGDKPKMRAAGCEKCNYAGYLGMMPVVEIYIPSSSDRAALMSGAPDPSLWDIDAPVRETGNPDDRSMALRLFDFIVSGETSADEGTKVMGLGFWVALARHYAQSGLFEGSVSTVSLATLAKSEAELLVTGASAQFAAELSTELRDAGYRVISVEPGSEPHEVLTKHPNVSLLLVDLEGDDKSARNMLQSLRGKIAWSGIPAIVLVPQEAPAVRAELEKRISNRVISKPATAADVAKVIRSLSWGEN
jgi:type II secretory ATPase GspE/PulE/Tfp pilus assembly ATPase PilB-like protein